MPYLADLLKRILDTMREGKMFYLEEAEGMMLAFLSEIARKISPFLISRAEESVRKQG